MKRFLNILFTSIFLLGCYPVNYKVLSDGVFGVGKIYRPFKICELKNVETDSVGFPISYDLGQIVQCYPNELITNEKIKSDIKNNQYAYSVSFYKESKNYKWCIEPCPNDSSSDTIPLTLKNNHWYMFTHIGELKGYEKDTIYFNYNEKGKFANYYESNNKILE